MSTFTNRTKKNFTTIVMTLAMLVGFSASAMAQNVTYVLTNELTPGEDYLIVSRNTYGTGYALQRDGNSGVTTDEVTVLSGGNVANNYYINNSTVDANSVWTVGSGYTFKNGNNYLYGYDYGGAGLNPSSENLRVNSSPFNWSWDSSNNRLSFIYEWTNLVFQQKSKPLYIRYHETSFFGSVTGREFDLSSDASNVYLYKKVRIIADPASLTLRTKVGEPVTMTFNVKCPLLKGNISATLSDACGYFSIDKTSVAASANGETITVTFLPLVTGTFTGTITLSSNYAQSVTVNLTGISEDATDYYPVTVSQYGYTTLYYDKALVIPYSAYNSSGNQLEDVSYISAANGSVATTTKLGTLIPANTGVVIKGTANKTFNFPYYKGTAPAAVSGNLLSGSISGTTTSEALSGHSSTSMVMTLSPNPKDNTKMGFYKFVGSSLAANKAFLIYDPGTNSGVNFLSITGMGDESSGIGQVSIRREDGAWHTLQGVRLNVTPTQPGIYIHGGKKVVVK